MVHSLLMANYTKILSLLIPPRGDCISKKFFVKTLKNKIKTPTIVIKVI